MENQLQLKVCGLNKAQSDSRINFFESWFSGIYFYEKSPRYVLNHLSLKRNFRNQSSRKVGVFVNETLEKL
jgi:phosphoribosylanthranilate isomerase